MDARAFDENARRADGTLVRDDEQLAARQHKSAQGTRDFVVATQEFARVDVLGPPVRVEGRITKNGKPIPNATITFSWRGDRAIRTPQAAEVKADAGGYYSTALDVPGKYLVVTRPIGTLKFDEVELVEGRNHHDINIVGGTITLNVIGLAPKSPLSVLVTNAAGAPVRGMMFGGGDRGAMTIEALPWGDYKISVSAGSGPIKESLPGAKPVSLSPSKSEVTLTFDISKR